MTKNSVALFNLLQRDYIVQGGDECTVLDKACSGYYVGVCIQRPNDYA